MQAWIRRGAREGTVAAVGLVGAALSAAWGWLRKHRDALAEAAQQEAAPCEAAAPRVERGRASRGRDQEG